MNARLANNSFKTSLDTQAHSLYSEWSPGMLINYVMENYHNYFKEAISDLLSLLDTIKNMDNAAWPELFAVSERFKLVSRDLNIHILKEELLIFPVIKELVRYIVAEEDKEAFPFERIDSQIKVLQNEHAYINEQMTYLRKLTNNFSPPVNTSQMLILLYKGLDDFSTKLLQYIYLENTILFPKAIELEHKLR